MNCTAFYGEGGFLECFGEGGVGCDCAGHVFGAAAVFHVCDGGCDEFGGVTADDLDT